MESTFTLKLMFAALPIALCVIATSLCKSRNFFVGSFSLLLITAGLAGSGILADFDALPPRMLLLLFPLSVATAVFAFRPIGNRFRDLPLPWLIAFQAFRLPLELMIYAAVQEGVAPPQFTWTGMNFDVVVGAASIALVPFSRRAPLWVLWCWNVLGLVLLFNVVIVAIISTPGPLQILTPDNTWIAHFPFIWLPTVCVMAAFYGHLVVTRKLIQKDAG